MPKSANFEFLRERSAQLFRLTALAEHYFPTDPNTTLIKLRQFAELLAQDAGARAGLEPLREEPLSDFLRRLSFSGYAPARDGAALRTTAAFVLNTTLARASDNVAFGPTRL